MLLLDYFPGLCHLPIPNLWGSLADAASAPDLGGAKPCIAALWCVHAASLGSRTACQVGKSVSEESPQCWVPSLNAASLVLAAGLSPARFPKACRAAGRKALSLVLTSCSQENRVDVTERWLKTAGDSDKCHGCSL